MNYTAQDIAKATELKNKGYKWIASEKPKYERLTDKDVAITLNTNYCEDMTRFYMYAQRLWELENKIESGELVFREVEE